MDQMLKLMNDMLNHACGSLSETPLTKDGPPETEQFNDGYQQYIIDTHCVRFTINAKIARDTVSDFEDPTRWDIRDWTTQNI